MKIHKQWFTPVLLTLALFAGACGKDNKSGGGSSQFGSNLQSYTGVQPYTTNNQYVNTVFQILPCLTTGGYGIQNQNQRIGTGSAMNFRVAAGAVHVGVSPEGDIAVLTGNQTGQAVLSLYLCPRASSGGASMQQNPAFGASTAGCRVNPITAANVYMQSPYGTLPVTFFAIDAIGTPGLPQLPQQFYQLKQSICF
ncbi:MAG: hypothetical protein K2P81_15700 [Bacteriovoracaceae bacterium]|nr:hypothetical protein [Bacteriovoracaceae bacterium]